MNLFRCLDFADLEDFLYHVRHVHMINQIQVVWKGGYKGGIKAITKGIRALQNRATGLKKLHLIVGNELGRRNDRCTWMVRRDVCSRRVSS